MYNKVGFNMRFMVRVVVIVVVNLLGGEFDRYNYKLFDEFKCLFD